jgi:hypothetical protein
MSYADFDYLMKSDVNFSSAWGDIQTHLDAEGAGPLGADVTRLEGAKTAFTDSFQQLSTGFGLSSGVDIATKAKSAVLLGHTLSGAISSVTGLVNSVTSGNSLEVGQAFIGTMVAAMTISGVATAGVGAAIVGAVGAVMSMLGPMLGKPPAPEYSICADSRYTTRNKPDWTVGCVAAYGNKISPGSSNWRPFPNEANKYKGSGPVTAMTRWDSNWFVKPPDILSGSTGGSTVGGTTDSDNAEFTYSTHDNGANLPLIDVAFPNYRAVVGSRGNVRVSNSSFMSAHPGVSLGQGDMWVNVPGFLDAYMTAWKHNQEYILNGIIPQSDEDVLIHLLRLWNHSHSGPTYELVQFNTPYANSLVYNAISANPTDLLTGSGLMINGGPILAATIPVVMVSSPATQAIAQQAIATAAAQVAAQAAKNTIVASAAHIQAMASASGNIALMQALQKFKQSPMATPQSVASIPKPKKNPMLSAGVGATGGFVVGGPIGATLGGIVGYLLGR